MRPGIAVSLVLHGALVVYLTYALAFHAPEKQKENDVSVTMIAPPPPPPPPPPPQQHVDQPVFIPALAPRIVSVPTSVPDLPIPAQPDLKRAEKPTVVTETKTVIQQPHAVKVVPPQYPSRAEDRQVEGYVDIDFTIEPDGSVGNPKIVAEVPEGYGFSGAAMKVFPQWKFVPKEINGNKVTAPAHYRFSFKLAK